ncbi:MAG: hypothetical protein EOP05_03240 [Proteobacteria bacterium]|nr:MAG: hypothetical protein EOP05_03240 [Pseudomonadota bacterium]
MNIKSFAFLFVSLFSSLQAFALTPHIDLRDLVKHGSASDQDEARALIAQINASPSNFNLPLGLSYSVAPLTAIGQATVSTAEVQNQTAAGFDLFLVYNEGKRVVLNKAFVNYANQVTAVESFDLTKITPTATIDILNRQMILQEPKSGFFKILPVSVGSLVHERIEDTSSPAQSLSRPFARAFLSRSKSEFSRTKPEYYSGRPFLRIIDQDQSEFGGFTPFGIHYQISDVFMRGFISNGCFRLRDSDLYELATLVFNTRGKGIPIAVVKSTSMGNRHPFPMIASWYNTPRVVIDSKGKAVFAKDEHDLFVFDEVRARPADLLRASGY